MSFFTVMKGYMPHSAPEIQQIP